VFVAGQLWQFKGWKWEKPVELFSHGNKPTKKDGLINLNT
jgi:hypothetical protein